MLRYILLFFALASITGCVAEKQNNGTLCLSVGVSDIYCKESACACVHTVAARSYDSLIKSLRENENIELTVEYFPEPYELEKAIQTGRFDAVIGKPFFIFNCSAGKRDFVRMADILDPKNNQYLTGIVIVKKDSPVKTVDGLSGKRIAIGQADAYEKHQAPLALFAKTGIKADLYEKAGCIEVIGELMDGQADAGVVSDYAFVADCAVDFTKPEDFRILAVTEKIPLTSFFVDSGKLSKSNMEKVKAALLKYSGAKTPEDFLGDGFAAPYSAPWEKGKK